MSKAKKPAKASLPPPKKTRAMAANSKPEPEPVPPVEVEAAFGPGAAIAAEQPVTYESPPAVGQLLAASRAAHLRKKQAAGVVDRDGNVTSAPNYDKAETHIAEALRLRLEANALDPEHTSPDWAADEEINGVSDAEMIKFFKQYPLIP